MESIVKHLLHALTIVFAVGFGGATQAQVERAELVLGLLVATPVSLLTALIGGWILHAGLGDFHIPVAKVVPEK